MHVHPEKRKEKGYRLFSVVICFSTVALDQDCVASHGLPEATPLPLPPSPWCRFMRTVQRLQTGVTQLMRS